MYVSMYACMYVVLTYEVNVTIHPNIRVSTYAYVCIYVCIYTVCMCIKVYVLLNVWSQQSLVFELFNFHVHFWLCDLCYSSN
jgi:hypothetical protein